MARKKGAFNKIVNIIGLVDDEPQGYDENYEQDYGRNYSGSARPSTYVPQQQRSRTESARSRTVISDNRYAASREYNEGYSVRRAERAYEDSREPAATAPRRAAQDARRENAAPARSANVPARTTAQANSNAPAQLPRAPRTIMCPITTLEECRDVIDILVDNNIVLLMLEGMDSALSQRAVDLLSGAAFALHATIKKASEGTYLIAPRTVVVSENDDISRRY